MIKHVALLTLLVVVFAQHDHRSHLGLDFITKEASRLVHYSDDALLKAIGEHKQTLGLMIAKHDKFVSEYGAADGASMWKRGFEKTYYREFDHALIAQSLCMFRFADDTSATTKCSVGIAWDHPYDTRTKALKDEFHVEFDEIIRQQWERYQDEQRRRFKQTDL